MATQMQDMPKSTGREDDPANPSRTAQWHPRWMVDGEKGVVLGIAIDDGCFVVLYPHGKDAWRPGTHIPRMVAKRIAELLEFTTDD